MSPGRVAKRWLTADEFQQSSRELEEELEKDLQATEKEKLELKEKIARLEIEKDEWKVSRTNRDVGTISRTHVDFAGKACRFAEAAQLDNQCDAGELSGSRLALLS